MPVSEARNRFKWAVLILAACGGLSGSQSSAMEHRIFGKSATDVFAQPHLAELANAACSGNAAGVRRAIVNGASPNGLGVDGGTPLLWAIACDAPKGVAALLEAGADPNFKVRGEFSAVFAASSLKDDSILRLLLSKSGDPNADDGKWTALRNALVLGSDTGRWNNYYSLLEADVDLNRLDPTGVTIAFHVATLNEYDKLVELLDRGYTRDLERIARVVDQGHYPPGNPYLVARDRAHRALQAKGVHYPLQQVGRATQ